MGVHTYTRLVACPLRFLIVVLALLLLPGCTHVVMGITAASAVLDRFEQERLEKKLDDLKKQLDKEKN